MTINVLNNSAFNSVYGRDNRLQNVGQQAQNQVASVKPQTDQAPVPTQRAEEIIAQLNKSPNLSVAYKREAIALTAVVDAAAPAPQREVALRELAGQFAKQVQANAPAPAALGDDEVAAIVQNARDALFGPRPRGEDKVDLTLQARARGVVDAFNEKPVQEAAYNLGKQAVAAIFGEPPGVKQPNAQPEQVQLPPARLPHEQLEHLAEIRQQMVDIIEG